MYPSGFIIGETDEMTYCDDLVTSVSALQELCTLGSLDSGVMETRRSVCGAATCGPEWNQTCVNAERTSRETDG